LRGRALIKMKKRNFFQRNFSLLIRKLFPTVPHSQSGAVPISSLLGVGQLGFWEFGRGGSTGRRVGQIGSVYKQPEKREDDSCHSWRAPSKWERDTKGN
jgi:hypothetical protein